MIIRVLHKVRIYIVEDGERDDGKGRQREKWVTVWNGSKRYVQVGRTYLGKESNQGDSREMRNLECLPK